MKTKIASLTLGFAAAVTAIGPAQSSGFGTFFAGLNANGAAVFSSGVASSAKTAVGKYEITFNRAINRCAFLVNVNGAVGGYGVTKKKAGTTAVLQVATFNKTGAPADFPTTVFIMCNHGD